MVLHCEENNHTLIPLQCQKKMSATLLKMSPTLHVEFLRGSPAPKTRPHLLLLGANSQQDFLAHSAPCSKHEGCGERWCRLFAKAIACTCEADAYNPFRNETRIPETRLRHRGCLNVIPRVGSLYTESTLTDQSKIPTAAPRMSVLW